MSSMQSPDDSESRIAMNHQQVNDASALPKIEEEVEQDVGSRKRHVAEIASSSNQLQSQSLSSLTSQELLIEQQRRELDELRKLVQPLVQRVQQLEPLVPLVKQLTDEISFLKLTKEDNAKKPLVATYIQSISVACKDADASQQFRSKMLSHVNKRGAFVAHDYYIDFVKAAFRMKTTGEADRDNRKWKATLETLTKYMKTLLGPLQHDEYKDTENPQSGVLYMMLQKALNLWHKSSDHGIFVEHHFNIAFEGIPPPNSKITDVEIIKKYGADEESVASSGPRPVSLADASTSPRSTMEESTQTEPVSVKIDFVPDVTVWFQDCEGRRCYLAVVEYDNTMANQSSMEERRVKVDMSVTNILEKYGHPCIAVDVEGSHTFGDWNMFAFAVAPSSGFASSKYIKSSVLPHTFEYKNGMFVEGILRLAVGLLAAKDSFEREFNKLLGPVVALTHNDVVVKAYYDGSTYCEPNIEHVHTFVDEKAVLLKAM